MKNKLGETTNMQSVAINQWANRLTIFLAEQKARLSKTGLDEIYQDFFSCFMKNSCSMFSLIPQVGMSYQVVQTMRLLIEVTADMNFIVKYPENIKHLKKEVNRLIKKCEHETDGSKWRDFIIGTGKMSLIVGDKLASVTGFGTKKRVEEVFGCGFYDFYSSYAHVNLFALRDDVCRFVAGDDFIAVQRWELIKDYPLVLEKFIHIIGKAANDKELAEMDCSMFLNGFNALFTNANEESVSCEQD